MVVVRAMDRKIERLERKIMKSEAGAKPAARFGHTDKDGYETIWVLGAAGVGRRMIHGVASTPTINSHKYSLASAGCQAKLPVPLKSEHAAGQIGEVVLLRKSAREIYVRAVLFDTPAADYAWSLIKAGETRCFSGASKGGVVSDGKLSYLPALVGDAVVDGVTFYKSWWLDEVSVCRIGANPDCHFDIFKG